MRWLIILTFLCGIQWTVCAQVEPNDRLSIAIGYGNGGTAFRGDLRLTELNIMDPFTTGSIKFYMELAFKRITFDEPNFTFNHINYPSNARVNGLGAGLSLDLKYNQWNINPYVGLRNYYVRFTDQTLIDAIGEKGLQRYWTDEWGNEYPVGPEVPNGYGDAVSFDIGGGAGYHITPVLEIVALLGLSPVTFDTGSTLFGPYFGEAPYPNSFYVRINSIRGELRLKFNF